MKLYLLLFVCLLLVSPLITIWSLNTLFPSLAIEYTFGTWFAVVWLSAFAMSSSIRK